jgi:radical SAM PhpK family P-methyltransferase
MSRLDCIVIGYNEPPFPRLEATMRRFGAQGPAYRDLEYSFVNIAGEPHTWIDLLNRTERQARERLGSADRFTDYRCGDIPNLAVVYLTNFLRRRGFSAEYINLFQHERDVLADLLEEDPVCVAITTTFYVTNHPAAEIVEFIRERRPDVPIVVGGPLIGNHVRRHTGPAELRMALADLGADAYVVDSQGELTLAQVIACLRAGGSLTEVPNLILADADGELTQTAIVPENNSLDENAIDWARALRAGAGATLQTRTARSCAFKCAFCAYPTRAGALTLASLETIEQELDSMMAYGGVRNVVFVDDTFNVPLPRFKQLCRLLIRRNYGVRWYSYFRCNNADDEAFELMGQSGCAGVFLGIESGSQPILVNMNKAVTVEQYQRGVSRLRAQGILTFGSFILGFPGESRETVRDTIAYIRALGLDYFRMQMWYCEPGTPIDRRREEFDLQGTAFNWRHRTMDATEAMGFIHDAFLAVDEAAWLPQWSFDFWILPYLSGRGIPMDAFKDYMTLAHRLLAFELGRPDRERRQREQPAMLEALTSVAARWCA